MEYATPDNAARNRATLIANIIRDLSLPANRTDWSVEQRFQFNNTFARFVVSHQTSFTADDYNISQTFLGERAASNGGYDPQLDDSFFGNIGVGVDSISSDLRNAIPKVGTAVLIGVIIITAFLIFSQKATISEVIKDATK